jgi:hypothetical protein
MADAVFSFSFHHKRRQSSEQNFLGLCLPVWDIGLLQYLQKEFFNMSFCFFESLNFVQMLFRLQYDFTVLTDIFRDEAI